MNTNNVTAPSLFARVATIREAAKNLTDQECISLLVGQGHDFHAALFLTSFTMPETYGKKQVAHFTTQASSIANALYNNIVNNGQLSPTAVKIKAVISAMFNTESDEVKKSLMEIGIKFLMKRASLATMLNSIKDYLLSLPHDTFALSKEDYDTIDMVINAASVIEAYIVITMSTLPEELMLILIKKEISTLPEIMNPSSVQVKDSEVKDNGLTSVVNTDSVNELKNADVIPVTTKDSVNKVKNTSFTSVVNTDSMIDKDWGKMTDDEKDNLIENFFI